MHCDRCMARQWHCHDLRSTWIGSFHGYHDHQSQHLFTLSQSIDRLTAVRSVADKLLIAGQNVDFLHRGPTLFTWSRCLSASYAFY